VGIHGTDGGPAYAILLQNGIATTLEVPGSRSTGVSGINDSGQIVGSYFDSSTDHSFLFENGSYITLDVPGSSQTSPTGINAAGQIVGNYWDAAAGKRFGFLFDNGIYTNSKCPARPRPSRADQRLGSNRGSLPGW
jgi:probable HAF family extracellular repeat protein